MGMADCSIYVLGLTEGEVRRVVDEWERRNGPALVDVERAPLMPGEPVAVDVFAATEDELERVTDSLMAELGDRAFRLWELPWTV
jgi:hypothetical protein